MYLSFEKQGYIGKIGDCKVYIYDIGHHWCNGDGVLLLVRFGEVLESRSNREPQSQHHLLKSQNRSAVIDNQHYSRGLHNHKQTPLSFL